MQPRELAIAKLVSEGAKNKEIALALGIGAHTVEGYVWRMREQLGLRNRAHLAAWFVGNFPTAAVGISPPSFDGDSPSLGASEAR